RTTANCRYNYFDPEPPLAKEIIAAGEWGYGWYRATFQSARGDYIDLGFNTFGWRIAACIFGVLCIPMMYLLARRLWPNRLFAIVALVIILLGLYRRAWYPLFLRGQFLRLADLINYQVQSFDYHRNLRATHPFGSPAWSWPFLARPVLYYAEYSKLGTDVFTGQ